MARDQLVENVGLMCTDTLAHWRLDGPRDVQMDRRVPTGLVQALRAIQEHRLFALASPLHPIAARLELGEFNTHLPAGTVKHNVGLRLGSLPQWAGRRRRVRCSEAFVL